MMCSSYIYDQAHKISDIDSLKELMHQCIYDDLRLPELKTNSLINFVIDFLSYNFLDKRFILSAILESGMKIPLDSYPINLNEVLEEFFTELVNFGIFDFQEIWKIFKRIKVKGENTIFPVFIERLVWKFKI